MRRKPIASRNPMPEGKSAGDDSEAGEKGVKEIESSHGGNANQVEESAFHSEVRERFVQALEHTVCATSLM
jgi:hypothetical protein